MRQKNKLFLLLALLLTAATGAWAQDPATTYSVKMKGGTVDAKNWTIASGEKSAKGDAADGLTGLNEGDAVTLQYNGRLKVKGVKATSDAAPAAPALNITSPSVGQVIGSDGKNYAYSSLPTGVTAVAVIAKVSGTSGLAIALADEEGEMNYDTAVSTAAAHTPTFTGGTWRLPTQNEWKQMFASFGGNNASYSGLNTAITAAGGTAFQGLVYYWSSMDLGGDYAYSVYLVGGSGGADWYEDRKSGSSRVRACLAFDIADAPSGPKVDWNAASKTGSFTMPGGNVELEPEYYPQAALTAAPSAINDVPATTDGAIVNAGTVANIGETTTAQGTVMYYVSQTALDDAALLALAADAWTADVPTAESFTAAGQAYVYYYVRGNDSDTDDENFSDGDIVKAANALTVTIAAAPTYAVTFADDLAEPDKWTASPAADVTKGETVTVTYTGTKKVLGVKAEKKAAKQLYSFTLIGPYSDMRLVVEFYEGDTWEDMVTKYSPTLQINSGKYIGFSSDGLVKDPTTHKWVGKTDQLVPSRAYYVE